MDVKLWGGPQVYTSPTPLVGTMLCVCFLFCGCICTILLVHRVSVGARAVLCAVASCWCGVGSFVGRGTEAPTG